MNTNGYLDYLKLVLLAIVLLVVAALLISIREKLPTIAAYGFIGGAIIGALVCGFIAWYKVKMALLDIKKKSLEVKQQEQLLLDQETTRQLAIGQFALNSHLARTRIFPDAKGYLPTLVSDDMQTLPGQLNVLMLPQYKQPAYALPEQANSLHDESPDDELILSGLPPLLSFADLLEEGIIQAAIARGEMVLGYVAQTHELRYGSWFDLYSAGNGGVTGSGKSTTTRSLLFQAVLASAKLIMIDPHIEEPEQSLAHQFSLLPASIHQIRPCDGRESNVLKRVRWLSKELFRRKNCHVTTPFLMFVIDEFNSLIRHLSKESREELAKLLLDIEQEGRKFGVFAFLIGQRWSAQDLGGADIRSSLASKLAHRFSDEDQAKKFIGSKYGKMLLELKTGHWLFYDTQGKTTEMITPETLAEDGAAIARILLEGSASDPTSNPKIVTSDPTSNSPIYLLPREQEDVETTVLVEPVDALTPQALQVLDLLKKKHGQNEIIEQVWGLKSSDGRPYRTAVEEYRVILAIIAQQIGA